MCGGDVLRAIRGKYIINKLGRETPIITLWIQE
jgi:hypothetical protein